MTRRLLVFPEHNEAMDFTNVFAPGGNRGPRDGLRRVSGPRWSIETVTSAAAGEPWLESEIRTIRDWTDAADCSDGVKTARSQPETDPLRFYRKRVCLFWK